MMDEKGYSRYELCTGGGNSESKSEKPERMRTRLTGEERKILTETVSALEEAVEVLADFADYHDVEIIWYKMQARLEALKRVMN